MVAYTMASYFGLDTSDYSINYLHAWTDGKEFNDKQSLLKEVRNTVVSYIDIIEESLIKEVSKKLEKHDGIILSSAREAISIYETIKNNDNEKLPFNENSNNLKKDKLTIIDNNIFGRSKEKDIKFEIEM